MLSRWGKKLTLWRLWHLRRRQKMMGVLKQRGCGQRFFIFLTILGWVNHNSKTTNGTLIQFMNYAVVMATLIKMRQSADLFVDVNWWYTEHDDAQFRDCHPVDHILSNVLKMLNSECLDHALNQFIVTKMPKHFFSTEQKKSNCEVVRISA